MADLLDFTAAADLVNALAVMAAKGILILFAVTIVCLALRNAAASLKHLCWGLGLGAVLLLPFLSLIVPDWNVGLLEEDATIVPARLAVSADEAATAAGADGVDVSAQGIGDVGAGKVAAALNGESAQAAVQQTPWSAHWPLATWIFVIWAIGAAAVFIHMLVSSLAVWRIVTKARPVSDPAWLDTLEEIGDRLFVRRPVQLLRSDRVSVPVAWGAIRPVILLPTDADAWSDERRRCVLAHEMAHVKRWDTLTQSSARAACAVHWFNPLAWKAASSMELEREKACDDLVLEASRTRASEYASHLLEIARRVPGSQAPPVGAIAMARRSQLEGRILAILDEGRRRSLARVPMLATLIAALLLVLPIAAMSPFGGYGGESERSLPFAEPLSPSSITLDGDPPSSAAAENPSASAPATAAAHDPVPNPTSTVASAVATVDAVLSGKFQPKDKLSGGAYAGSASDVVERTFKASDGGWLRIDADHGNVQLKSGTSGQVHVEVRRNARGSASEDDYQVTFEQSGDKIIVIGENRLRNSGRNGVNVSFIVTVPRRFNVDVETAGGNITVDNLDGRVKLNTSGGNLSLGRITGEVDAHTSGGNISLDGSDADVVVNTSGGNISLGKVGGTVNAMTSGGNITVDEVNGEINAKTSGGQITARLARQPQGDCLLRTSGGSITVYLADGIGVDLEAETSAGHVNTDVEIATIGKIKKDRLQGKINGGGPLLELDTSAGDIRIRRL